VAERLPVSLSSLSSTSWPHCVAGTERGPERAPSPRPLVSYVETEPQGAPWGWTRGPRWHSSWSASVQEVCRGAAPDGISRRSPESQCRSARGRGVACLKLNRQGGPSIPNQRAAGEAEHTLTRAHHVLVALMGADQPTLKAGCRAPQRSRQLSGFRASSTDCQSLIHRFCGGA
jgi:hypothetical protein